MKPVFQKLLSNRTLSGEEAHDVLLSISRGEYNNAETALFLGLFMARALTVDELRGFRDALLELCIKPSIYAGDCIDMCGTGGDGKNTFNISTTSAFVVAGAGYRVTKHGNYGVSSHCGSSNVLESLGYRFTNNSTLLQKQLDTTGLCFLHAPLFHPAMKNVAPVRQQLGMKTFFNMLGPLVNPARPGYQSVGVYNLEIARLYNYLFQDDPVDYVIAHTLDGYDEVSLTSPCLVISNSGEQVLEPSHFGLNQINPHALNGGQTVKEARRILIDVLSNNATNDQKNVVVANAGLAIQCLNQNNSLEESMAEARASLDSGAAKTVLDNILKIAA